jgi:hypothetical protein
VIVTAASFPTPDLIKQSNNPAVWDQQDRFAEFQAAAANEALERLGPRLDAASSELERSAIFVQLYRDLAEWRYRLAHHAEGQSPNAGLEQYHAPIGNAAMVDPFGPGLRSEGSRLSATTGRVTGGPETPASRLSARLGEIIHRRIETEAPGRDVLENQVRLPDGSTITGNRLLRGKAAAEQYSLPRPVEGFCCTMTGRLDDRRALQREAFGILGDLETQRAAGRDLLDDPTARRAFVAAEYYLYQGPEYQRGGDATIRVLLATSHTRLFGAAPKLPQDIDVMAYVAGQEAFHEHVERTQAVLSAGGGRDVSSQGAAAERACRARPRGLERD